MFIEIAADPVNVQEEAGQEKIDEAARVHHIAVKVIPNRLMSRQPSMLKSISSFRHR